MTDWDWYLAKRRGEPVQMNPDNPQPGFYRKPKKERYGARRTFLPVAYYWFRGEDENGEPLPAVLRCREGDRDVSELRGLELWKWVGDHDRDETEWRRVAEEGGLWDDEHELVPMQGDNLPPEDHSFEGLRDSIEDLAHEAAERIEGPPIADQAEADRIANLADRLAELHKIADEQKKEEKRPHDEGAKFVQQKWAPLLLRAETYKNLKYILLTPWLKKLEDARKKEAEAAAAAGEPAAAQPRRSRAGTRGRAMTLKSVKRAEIVDYALCLEFFKDSPDVKATVEMLANRAVRAGISVPGTKVIEESQAV